MKKIVIDIDENVFTRLFDNGTDFYDTDDILAMTKAIRKGITLPKGHKFIDADEILNHAFIEESEEGNIFVKKYYCIRKEIMDNALVLFDTLEADTTESEDKG